MYKSMPFLCMYVYSCVYVIMYECMYYLRMYICIYVSICVYMYACMNYVCIYRCLYLGMHVCMCIFMYISIPLCTFVYMNGCMYMYVCMYVCTSSAVEQQLCGISLCNFITGLHKVTNWASTDSHCSCCIVLTSSSNLNCSDSWLTVCTQLAVPLCTAVCKFKQAQFAVSRQLNFTCPEDTSSKVEFCWFCVICNCKVRGCYQVR